MKTNQSIEQISISLCSVDGENWFEISEILALCAINDHYLVKKLDSVLEHYNKGHIVPVRSILYKRKK